MLTRENIKSGLIARMIREGDPSTRVLSAEELIRSRRAVLNTLPGGDDLWIFGYGSLIWNPAFHYVERRVAHLHGFHRQYCLWTHLGRGTREVPGLLLGLEAGGSCRGVAFRIAADAIETETDIIWRREMVSGAYRPRWVTLRGETGPFAAIAFTINRAHDRYSGPLPEERIVEAIAEASGPLGPCADYLMNTVQHLEELGIRDATLRRLHEHVLRRLRDRS